MPTPAADLAALAEDLFTTRNEVQPLFGAVLGVPDAPRVPLPDVSAAGEAAARARWADLRTRLVAIPTDDLDDTERTTHAMLGTLLDEAITAIDLRVQEMACDAFFSGAQAVLVQALPKTVLADDAAAEDYLARLDRIPGYLDAHAERLVVGATTGRTATQMGVEAAIAQCRALAATPADAHPFLLPFGSADSASTGELRDGAAALVVGPIAEALRRHAEVLEADVLPHARPDDEIGLCNLEDGAAIHAALLAQHTTTTLKAEEIHQIGLDVIASLDAEYAAIGERLFGTTDRAEIFERLRTDPALRYDDPAEAVADAQACVDRAAAVVDRWIGRLPATPCTVTPIPEVAAKGMTVAYYQPPALGADDAHGTYWINTTGPVVTRYESACVAFHETIPGHHTQFALQADLDLPRFRQVGTLLSGYQEGWGLYTERLCDEMGLYTGDLDRLGMLAMDSLRGCRLVLDTGIHHLGWSRQQALDYMLANAPVSEAFALAEVNRYCVYPGQACAYMIGRHEIVRLRALAEAELGERFDIRAFHDVVLGQGSVPLTTLAANVERWIAAGPSDASA